MKRPFVQQYRLRQLLTATIAAIGAIAGEATVLAVQAASLTQWSFDPAANQLEITVKDGTTPRYFLMAQPARIVVDLPDTALGAVSAQQTYSGAVRQIRVSQFEPGLTRIVMEISPGVSLAPGQVKLQKVGSETAASNSRWVLQPLITKSISANAVTIKPSVPSQARSSRIASGTSAVKPQAARSVVPPAATAASAKPPSVPTQSPTTNDRSPVSTLPKGSNAPVASTSQTATSQTAASITNGNSIVAVPDIDTVPPAPPTAVPIPAPAVSTTAPALAPALPSPPSEAQAAKPLPPTATSPVDPNVAVDTQGGVAIAVPTPKTSASEQGAPPQTLAAATVPLPASPPPLSTARIDPSRTNPPSAKPATTLATASPTRSPKPTLAYPPTTTSTTSGFTTAEIPTTLVANTAALSPSVTVPPLTAPSNPSNRSEPQTGSAQVRPPDVAFEIPSDGLPAGASASPTVSVPPPIQVGSPSLGTTGASTLAAPSVSVFAPNASIEPPVSVPPLQQAPVQPSVPPLAPQSGATPGTQTTYDANTIRQPTSSANLAPPLNVVPLPPQPSQPSASSVVTPGYDADTVRQAPPKSAPASIVEFGQPLPAKTSTERPSQPFNGLTASQGVRQAFKPTAPNVLLPAGTLLNLRYPGDSALLLSTDRPQQEVLVLLTELRDAAGNLLAPVGSAVTGRFETTTSGSQFVTQAIAVNGRTIPLTAQSDTLDGSRKVQGNNLAVNSGIGLVAGGVLGAVSGSAGLGALGGAAAGAAATLITAPKPAAIQPGQVVQVRLTQDLRSVE
ncbi:MAG: AMIN domain-containing protein [Leptolyngbya sp. BL-A-14]